RDAGELDLLVEVERITDPQCGGVDESDDIAGKGLVDDVATAPEDLLRVLRGEGFAGGRVGEHRPAFEHAGADADEGETVAMVRVHSGLDLEDESGERSVDGTGLIVLVQTCLGGGGEVDEHVEEFVDAEIE